MNTTNLCRLYKLSLDNPNRETPVCNNFLLTGLSKYAFNPKGGLEDQKILSFKEIIKEFNIKKNSKEYQALLNLNPSEVITFDHEFMVTVDSLEIITYFIIGTYR